MKKVGVAFASLGLLAAGIAAASPAHAATTGSYAVHAEYRGCSAELMDWVDTAAEELDSAVVESAAGFSPVQYMSSAIKSIRYALKDARNAETRALMKSFIRLGKYGVYASDLRRYVSLLDDILDNVNRGKC